MSLRSGIGVLAWWLALSAGCEPVAPNEPVFAADGGGLTGNGSARDPLRIEKPSVPAGTIIAFGGANPPEGWAPCDGHSEREDTRAGLFAAIGRNYGGDASRSTFNVPDLRGRFLRGVDNGIGHDPDAPQRGASNAGGATGDNPGSLQADDFRGHGHSVTTGPESAQHTHNGTTSAEHPSRPKQTFQDTAYGPMVNAPAFEAYQFWGEAHSHTFVTSAESGTHSHGGTTDTTGGRETRPANLNVNFLIKY